MDSDPSSVLREARSKCYKVGMWAFADLHGGFGLCFVGCIADWLENEFCRVRIVNRCGWMDKGENTMGGHVWEMYTTIGNAGFPLFACGVGSEQVLVLY